MSAVATTSESRDQRVREIQEHEMPEGAPPPPRARRRAFRIGFICTAVLALATFAALFAIDGSAAILVGAAMLVAYAVLGGATAIVAVAERAHVRRQLEERLAQNNHDAR